MIRTELRIYEFWVMQCVYYVFEPCIKRRSESRYFSCNWSYVFDINHPIKEYCIWNIIYYAMLLYKRTKSITNGSSITFIYLCVIGFVTVYNSKLITHCVIINRLSVFSYNKRAPQTITTALWMDFDVVYALVFVMDLL